MPETSTYTFNHQEVAEALIKFNNLHEGHWMITVEFGISAANIQTGENQFSPAAIVPVLKIGLAKVGQEMPLSVNASIVNPS